jgi:hypothetical protein
MTLDAATAALTKIANVDITIVKIGIGDYVPAGNLRYVVMVAREALGLPREVGKP